MLIRDFNITCSCFNLLVSSVDFRIKGAALSCRAWTQYRLYLLVFQVDLIMINVLVEAGAILAALREIFFR